MLERERLAMRARREQLEAEERAEKERIEAPIRRVESEINHSVNELAKVYRERLLGKVKDPDPIPVDPHLIGITMSRANADKFNRAEFVKFKNEHPDIFWTQELLGNLGAYYSKQGLQIISAGMIASLVDRYRTVGLLPDPPEPEPVPELIEPEPEKPVEPELEHGWDDSGNPLTLTRRQVDRLSSVEYRRFKRLDRAALEDSLPRLGPGARRLV